MTETKYCRSLELDIPDGLQNDIVSSLASLPADRQPDERGRQLWIYWETPQIREYTNIVLSKMDPLAHRTLSERGLKVCAIEKGPRVVRTGDGPSDYQQVQAGSIAIITPMTREKVPIWLAEIGVPFADRHSISAGKQDSVIIFPGTKFRLRDPYYLMVRPVRKVETI